ncbi:MAG: hypothetical protein IJ413_02840 [Bacteroides sp.]|nr:hypothetical protein [Bacteroides sp.]
MAAAVGSLTQPIFAQGQLTARQSLLGTQLQQSANRFMQIQSVINLYQALGGGQN